MPYAALAVALVICGLSIAPWIGFHFQYLPGQMFDTRLAMFLLEHGNRWVSGQAHSFFDAPFYYPVRGVMAYSDLFLGQLPFYVPWRWMGLDRETAFQVFVVTGYLLNFLAAAWVLTKLRLHWVAALFGAYIFSFAQPALAQIGHPQLIYRFAIPPAFYFLHRFLERFSAKDLFWCLFFVVWQSAFSFYLAYFLVLFLAAFTVVTLVTRPVLREYIGQATTASVLKQLAMVAVCAAILAVEALPYAKVGDAQLAAARRPELIRMLPRPISYLVSWPGNYETGWLFTRAGLPMAHEHTMYPGLIAWACVLFLLFTARRSGRHPVVLASLLAMLSMVALTLHVRGFSFYNLLMRVPGVVGIRAVARVILVLLLPIALAVAQVSELLQRRLKNIGRPLALGFMSVAVVALAAENHITAFRFTKAESQQRLRDLERRLPAGLPNDAILAYLNPNEGLERQFFDIDAMLLAQDKHAVTVNGYSGRAPKGYHELRTCADLKYDLDSLPRENDSPPVQNTASRVVVIGTAADMPCTHLDAPFTFQTEPLPENGFRARIEVSAPPSAAPGAPVAAHVRVTNQSNVTWRAGVASEDERNAIHAACRWMASDSEGAKAEYDNRFTLPYDLRSGESADLVAYVTAPATPDSYALECDLVQERVSWFEQKGSPVGRTPVTVTGGGAIAEGYLDRADSQQIAGWAWKPGHANQPVPVEIYDGPKLLATIRAATFRPDLLAAHKGDGAHSFTYIPPQPLRGGPHTIRAVVAGTNFELPGSPKEFVATR